MKIFVILATLLAIAKAEAPSGGYRITDVGPNYKGYGGGSKFPLIGDSYGLPAYSLPPVTTTTTTTNRPSFEYGLPNQSPYTPPQSPPTIDREYGTPQNNFSPAQPAIPTTRKNFEIYRAPVQFIDEIPNVQSNYAGTSPDFIQAIVKEFGSEIPKISNEYGTPRRSEDNIKISQQEPRQPNPEYPVPPSNLYSTLKQSSSQNLSPDRIVNLSPPL